MSNDIYLEYNIDLSRLKRDYIKNPIKYIKNRKNIEKPFKEDLEYLYNELNIRRRELATFFNVSDYIIKLWLKELKIKKPIPLRLKNHYDTLEKEFGVRHNSLLEKTKKAREKTSLSHFGTRYPVQSEIVKKKIKDTCDKKYNGHNPTLIGSKEFEERMIKKYGVKYYVKTDYFKNLFKDKKFIEEWLNKLLSSKIKNNSFSKSRLEDESYDLLLIKYPNIKRQYKSNLYPFFCDLYIPELDLYIELNYHWTHGNEPFIGTDEQKKKVKIWEEKSKEINLKNEEKNFYKNAIYVWTDLDVRKKECFIKNNLNYMIFYDIISFKEWVKGL